MICPNRKRKRHHMACQHRSRQIGITDQGKIEGPQTRNRTPPPLRLQSLCRQRPWGAASHCRPNPLKTSTELPILRRKCEILLPKLFNVEYSPLNLGGQPWPSRPGPGSAPTHTVPTTPQPHAKHSGTRTHCTSPATDAAPLPSGLLFHTKRLLSVRAKRR